MYEALGRKQQQKKTNVPQAIMPGIGLPTPSVAAAETGQALPVPGSLALCGAQGWVTSLGVNAATDSFFPKKCTWANLAEWMCWMLEFFIWNRSWSDFKLGRISYLCFCVYLLRTARSFEELRRQKTWMCSRGLKETKKIWFFLE